MRHWIMAALVTVIGIGAVACSSCAGRHDGEQAVYQPIADAERAYGPLVSAGNHPTLDQHGTGERIGLFRSADGTIWGLPVSVVDNAVVLACAPPALQNAKVTDSIDAGWSVIGSTNEPTGWRGGTGNLELLLRDRRGTVRLQGVRGADLPSDPACWAPRSPGPRERLHYYRLAPTTGNS
jgi:hypothetical protein